MSRIVFRTDAGPAIGSGHVMRSLALASAFSRGGWHVGFAATQETFDTMKPLVAADVEKLILAGSETEAQVLAGRWPQGADILVVDHYGRDASFERACRPWAKRIVVVDDLADRPHDCDVLTDSSTPSAENYRKLVPAHCRVLVGPAFAPLAREFRLARPSALARRDGRPVERVLVSFGQIDLGNASELALDALDAIGFEGAIDVVLGSAAPHLAAVRKRTGSRSKLHVDILDMPALMSAADIALGAGGTTSWERCCLGLPALMLEIADNQRGVIAAVERAKAGIRLGRLETSSKDDIATALRAFLKDKKQRMNMAVAGAGLVDGRGTERMLLAAVGPVVAKTGREIGLRLMEEGEEAWLLDLQKKPETRKFSNVTRIPSIEEHAEWFSGVLADPDILLATIESGSEAVGMLRLDRQGEIAKVSIAVDPTYHRHGIGEAALALAARISPGRALDAQVKPENKASLALFAAAGYRHVEKDLYRREPL